MLGLCLEATGWLSACTRLERGRVRVYGSEQVRMCVKRATNVHVAPGVFDGTKEESDSKGWHKAAAAAFNGASWWRCMYVMSLKLMGIIWPLMNWMRTETIKQWDAVSSLLLLCFSFWIWCSTWTNPVIKCLQLRVFYVLNLGKYLMIVMIITAITIHNWLLSIFYHVFNVISNKNI